MVDTINSGYVFFCKLIYSYKKCKCDASMRSEVSGVGIYVLSTR